jgi:hypothetical protein
MGTIPDISAAGEHLRAYERFGRAVDANDDVAANQEGRVITDPDKAGSALMCRCRYS